jgi:hypothetical protein
MKTYPQYIQDYMTARTNNTASQFSIQNTITGLIEPHSFHGRSSSRFSFRNEQHIIRATMKTTENIHRITCHKENKLDITPLAKEISNRENMKMSFRLAST